MFIFEVAVPGLFAGGLYAIFALGLSLSVGVLRVINIAHAAMLTLAPVLAIEYAGSSYPGSSSIFVVILVGVLVGVACGLLQELVMIRPIRRAERLSARQAERATLIGSVAIWFVLNSITIVRTHAQVVPFPRDVFASSTYRWGDVYVSTAQLVTFGTAIVLFGALAVVIAKTQMGRQVRALANDHEAAGLIGVNVDAYSAGCSALAGALAGLAGMLLAMTLSAFDYANGTDLLAKGFVIVVVGGLGSIGGTFVVALGLGVAEAFLGFYFGTQWQTMAAFGILVLVLLARPGGLLGVQKVRAV